MDNFMEGQEQLMDPSALQKCGLEVVHNLFRYRGQAARTYLRKDPLENVDHRNRPKVSDVRSPNYFGDKGYGTIVYEGHI